MTTAIVPRIISVASAFPENKYTQAEVCTLLGVTNPVVLRAAAAPHIHTRHLMLDVPHDYPTAMPKESLSQLNARFHRGIATIGLTAARDAMQRANITAEQIGTIVTVTSSGLALPGLSAILIRDLGINRRAHRADLVGMGCNAGISGLRTVSQMLAARPVGTYGLLLCCEINSALHVRNENVGSGVVNSLFGDGAAAVVVQTQFDEPKPVVTAADRNETVSNTSFNKQHATHLRLVDFESATYPELFDDMRYEVDEDVQQYNFLLSKRIPFAVSQAIVDPVQDVLSRAGLTTRDVRHWLVHSGGAAVIEGVVKHLGLETNALRHTISVLRDYGNLSSGSVLVSLQRLIEEDQSLGGVIVGGDAAVLIGMGPGATIEVSLGFFE